MIKDGKRQISWQSADYSLNFKANDDKLDFNNTDNLANANDNYSGGLLFLGLCLNVIRTSLMEVFIRYYFWSSLAKWALPTA